MVYEISMTEMLAAITWRPRIGDPTLMDWCITGGYLAASVICFVVARREGVAKPEANRSSMRFWLALAAMMLALGLNKQLDLQTLLTQMGREIARSGGWYGERRVIQAAFAFNCAVLGAVFAGIGLRMIWGQKLAAYLAYLGVVFLVTFVVIRAASFHHIDTILYRLPAFGNRVNFGLEFGGILLVVIGGLMRLLKSTTASKSGNLFR